MQYIIWIGAAVTLLAYIPLLISAWRGDAHLNIATWLIWSFIDAVLFFSLVANHADAALAGAFGVGNIIVVFAILKSGVWHWRSFEALVLVGAVISLGVWYYISTFAATVTIVIIKYCIAIAPSFRDAYKNPEKKQVLPWAMYSLGGLLSIIGAGSWTLSNSFYPTVSFIANGAMALLHGHKRKVQ